MDETAYEELVAKIHSARDHADKKKHEYLNHREFAAIGLSDEEIASSLETAASREDWSIFEILLLKANASIRKQTLIPINADVPKPKKRFSSYFISRSDDIKKDVPRVKYQKPTKPIAWVPLLCKVLDARHDGINNEDIVDALDLPADSRALPSLERALTDYPTWPEHDSYGDLAVKAIQAIERISTPEAMDALRKAHTNPQITQAPNNEKVMRAFERALKL